MPRSPWNVLSLSPWGGVAGNGNFSRCDQIPSPLKGGGIPFVDAALSGIQSDWMLLFLNINYCWLPWTATIRFGCRGVRVFLRIERLASTRAWGAQTYPFVVVPLWRLTFVRRLRGLAYVPLSLSVVLLDSWKYHRKWQCFRVWHAKRPIHLLTFSWYLQLVQEWCVCFCMVFLFSCMRLQRWCVYPCNLQYKRSLGLKRIINIVFRFPFASLLHSAFTRVIYSTNAALGAKLGSSIFTVWAPVPGGFGHESTKTLFGVWSWNAFPLNEG